jgi:hypothetical protein
MRSFLDHENAFYIIVTIILAIPLVAGGIVACTTPSEGEMDKRYAEHAKENLVVVSPRPGVECYILRGSGSGAPRAMSCVGTIPITHGN